MKCLYTAGQTRYFDYIAEVGKTDSFPGSHEHHITPSFFFRDLGVDGADDPSNICYLTPSQHLTAHWTMPGLFDKDTIQWAKAVYALHILSYQPDVSPLICDEERGAISKLFSKASSSLNPARWEDSEYRRKHSDGQKRRYEDPEARRKTGEATARHWEDPAERQKRSKFMTGMVYWNNGVRNKRSREWPGEGWERGKLVKSKAS